MSVRAPLDARAVSLVLILCLVWGLQQVVMKGVASDVPPVLQLAIRFTGAALFYGAWVIRREGVAAFADGTLRSGLLLGSLFAAEFVFAGQSLNHTSAAHCIVFLYTAPIFSALGLHMLPEERLDAAQWVGIGVAFAGIVVAFLGFHLRPVGGSLEGDGLALCAGMAWGVSNVVLRRGRVRDAATAKTVFYQVATAAVVLGVFAVSTGQAWLVPSAAAIGSLVFQTTVISVVTYLVWFWLLRHYLTSRLMLLTLLTPLFGVLFGITLTGDTLQPQFAVGATLVLIGVLVVNLRFLKSRT